VNGVRWSAPLVLPRDLDLRGTYTLTEADTFRIAFPNLNPQGSNGIHYIQKIDVAATSLTPGAEARVVSQSLTDVEVALFDASGAMVPGKVKVAITGKARVLIAFEEFNSAPPSVVAASYQIILDRRLGEYVVPEGCYMAAMGNRDTDKGVTFKMPTPVMNRFVHIEMEPNFDDWQMWALGALIHPDVVGYLSAFKDQLFQFDAGTAARGFPTPRSWHFVSDILTHNEYLPIQVMMGLIIGAVGEGSGSQFIEFRKVAKDLPKPEAILSGVLKKLEKEIEVALAYALITTLCYELKARADDVKRKNGADWKSSADRQKWLKEADNFLAFLMENFDNRPEICVMGVRAAIQSHQLPFETTKMKNFDVFARKYKDLIVARAN